MTVVINQIKDIVASVMYAAEGKTLEQVLHRIASVSRELVNAKYAALGVPDGTGKLKYFKAVGLSDEEIAKIGHPPVGLGLLGAIMNERETLRLPEMTEHERSVGFPENHPSMTSLLGVPIQVGSQLFGMLYLCDRIDGAPFTEDDEWLIKTLAGYAALAIAGAQLSEQKNRLTLLEERERVGMELHDGIIQSLYAVGMNLQFMRLAEDYSPEEVDRAIGSLDKVIEDIRAYILDLKHVNHETQSLYDCIADSIARLSVPDDLTITISASHDENTFSPFILEAVSQIVNEATSNVIRHAQAKHLRINGTAQKRTLKLILKDDGQGFDINRLDQSTGLGITNMRQRVKLNDGRMEVNTGHNQGTTMTFYIPLDSIR